MGAVQQIGHPESAIRLVSCEKIVIFSQYFPHCPFFVFGTPHLLYPIATYPLTDPDNEEKIVLAYDGVYPMAFEDILEKIINQGVDGTSEKWLNDIQNEYGRVPLIFKRMAEKPEILISHLLYKGAITQTSTIEPKYIELISLAVGAALKCPHCVDYHARAAMRKGANREEILEVILISGLLANAAILANAYRIIDKVETCVACDINVNGVDINKTSPG
jgi:AhpD family alkylhydroperoxidase